MIRFRRARPSQTSCIDSALVFVAEFPAYPDLPVVYQKLIALARRLDRKEEAAELARQADRLSNDPAALEELARGELGLMRPGEKVFIVKDLKPPAAH